MAKESSGIIDDDRTYTAKQLAHILQRSERWVKDFLRGTGDWKEKGHFGVPYADLGNGMFVVSGRKWRLAIEAMSNVFGEDEE